MNVDCIDFNVTKLPSVSVSLPSWSISGKLVNSETQELVKDFTGENSITFPDVLDNLSVGDRQKFEDMLLSWILNNIMVN